MSILMELPETVKSVVTDPPLSFEEFERLCAVTDNVRLELNSEGAIIVNPPAAGATGSGNAAITYQLYSWWRNRAKRRGRTFDSSAGFCLRDGSVLNPDSAYVSQEQAAALTVKDLAHFLRVCPVFVIELLSRTDSISEAEKKMRAWISNGALVAWLVNPYAQTVTIYTPDGPPSIEKGLSVAGTGPVEGFLLDLSEVWSCYRASTDLPQE